MAIKSPSQKKTHTMNWTHVVDVQNQSFCWLPANKSAWCSNAQYYYQFCRVKLDIELMFMYHIS